MTPEQIERVRDPKWLCDQFDRWGLYGDLAQAIITDDMSEARYTLLHIRLVIRAQAEKR